MGRENAVPSLPLSISGRTVYDLGNGWEKGESQSWFSKVMATCPVSRAWDYGLRKLRVWSPPSSG